ncbi:something about silencing, SAS, complex subunit 4-domain-containing protein [Aspergillus nidulans var. acristatus]
MRKALVITATAISGLSLAVSLYFSHQKRYLASQVRHSSERGQLSPSTPRNVSSISSDIFSSKYYTLYDYASISAPRHSLPDLEPSQLLIALLRRNMSSFASSPQARLLKIAASDPETIQSFDRAHIAALDFDEGDLVCNAYKVKLRAPEKVEFEFLFGVQGRLVVSVEVKGEDVVFHNETLMWREDTKNKLPLENGFANWVHELTAWWMLESGVSFELTRSGHSCHPSRIQFPLPRVISHRHRDVMRPVRVEEIPSRFSPLPTDPMTSTAIMPARSRSSLRVLRRDPNATNDDSAGVQPPPPKRPRLNLFPSRRRKSSPDLLDTTIDSSPSTTSTKLRRPRPLLAHSAHTTSSPPPGSSTPRARNLRQHHTPNSNSAALYLNDGRESPDPLDTISPAPALKPSTITTSTPTPTSAAYRQRRLTQYLKPASEKAAKDSSKSKNTRPARGSTVPPPSDESAPQSLAVPAETADRAVPEKRRSLRSHDGGSRAKSELALYFPNYDQIMSLEPPKTELLSENTVIKLIDDLTEPLDPASASSSYDADAPFGNPLVNLYKCDVITLPHTPLKNESRPDTEAEEGGEEDDPLNEEFYFKAHRRHERQEKQLRNIERDRARHDQQQLDRLLDELQGHDWLRVMGITGRSLSEQEKKLYEPKRDYFIAEISTLLQKFKIWKEEEKRRKLDKDYKSASFHSDAAEPSYGNAKDNDRKDEDEEATAEPTSDDVDALAARQLLHEARSATAGKRPKAKTEQQELAQSAPPPLPDPLKPFTSFFAKPHLRAQAMSGNRKGRTRLAFGHLIPELGERDFELPGVILTREAIKDCQRKRRRMKRERASSG